MKEKIEIVSTMIIHMKTFGQSNQSIAVVLMIHQREITIRVILGPTIVKNFKERLLNLVNLFLMKVK